MLRRARVRSSAPGVARAATAGLLGVALAAGSVVAARPSASPAPSVAAVAGSPGATSLGDPFYPSLGNGGYDTLDLVLTVTWSRPDAAHPDGPASVEEALYAVATQDLSAFSLDIAPASVTVKDLAVDGQPAAHRVDAAARKLLVTPATPIPAGTAFRVDVTADVVPGPVPRTGEDGTFVRPGEDEADVRTREGRGLIADGAGGVLLAAQPNGAHTLVPLNDTPGDKAATRITLIAPPGMLGIATGELQRLSTAADGTVTTTWVSREPVASHVLSLGIGEVVLRSVIGGDGVTYRSAIPTDVEPVADPVLQQVPGIVDWLAEAIGTPYPFPTFGLLAYAGEPTRAILEGQSLVLLPASLLLPIGDRCRALGTIAHEAAHQWFGDRAGIGRWDEKWLSEGHATYWQWRWMAANGCLPAPVPARAPSSGGAASPDPSAAPDADAAFLARVRRAYEAGAAIRASLGAPSAIDDPASAYTPAIYDQGALALEALRQEVGDATFGRIERRLLTRFADEPMTTDGFIRVASRVAGRDLGPFLEAWLRGPVLPPMPGHPGWTSEAPPTAPPAAPPSPAASPIPGTSPVPVAVRPASG
ncbi:MAG: M1 family aminopeptidase [Chloroflexota bacterium]